MQNEINPLPGPAHLIKFLLKNLYITFRQWQFKEPKLNILQSIDSLNGNFLISQHYFVALLFALHFCKCWCIF